MSSDVIVAAPRAPHSLREFQMDHLIPRSHGLQALGSSFNIRNVGSAQARHSAGHLLNRMYARRGYTSNGLNCPTLAHSVTLAASDEEATRGTISVGFDSAQGLLVDECFPQETHKLRTEGRRICEFKKLAVDSGLHSKRVLASLFHVAYATARHLRDCDNVLIEINPRHVRYYQRMLGFEVLGPERLNPRVNAPALLLCLDLAYAQEQIAYLGGRPDAAEGNRSLYPYFFSPAEEQAVVQRLRASAAATSAHPSLAPPPESAIRLWM
jgi:hypothetical protein